MSKRVARIAISVLITLIIVAAVYTTVFGAASRGVSSARVQVTAGLLPDLNHTRIQAASASGYYTGLVQQQPHKVHDCDGSSSFDE